VPKRITTSLKVKQAKVKAEKKAAKVVRSHQLIWKQKVLVSTHTPTGLPILPLQHTTLIPRRVSGRDCLTFLPNRLKPQDASRFYSLVT